jgi:hypothetical protein
LALVELLSIAACQVEERKKLGDLRGKLTNNAHMFRDPRENRELVWRMACLWVASLPLALDVFGARGAGGAAGAGAAPPAASGAKVALPKDFLQKEAEWRKGHMDVHFMERCRHMPADFQLSDLRHIKEKQHAIMGQWTPDALSNTLNQAKLAQEEASYALLKQEVLAEQGCWSRFSAELAQFNDTSLSVQTRQRELAEQTQEALIKAHMATSFNACCLADYNYQGAVQATTQAFADQGTNPRVALESIMRLNVVNLTSLGTWHSLRLNSLAQTVLAELVAHPRTSCALIFLPNTPIWGLGLKPGGPPAQGQVWEEKVEEAKQAAIATFAALPDTRLRMIGGQWDHLTMCPRGMLHGNPSCHTNPSPCQVQSSP